MRRLLRSVGRAPVRILASVFALTLALGAIGVLAVPDVATSSLRNAAEQDRLADISVGISATDALDLDALASIPEIDAIDGQVRTSVGVGGATVRILGVDVADQRIDVVRAEQGRLPTADDEIVVSSGMAAPGDELPAITPAGDTTTLHVVGVGSTSAWAGEDIAFTTLSTARAIAGSDGYNRLVASTVHDDADTLDATVDALRVALAAGGATMTTFPVALPGDEHPVEADIAQVSLMIGLLGIVAGVVALVLLASTTTTLVTERSREVAVMRALGGRRRALRRRLRRLALGIAAASVVLGVPLGIVVSNVLARIVLGELLGITPGIAVSVPVVVGSALFALVGARLVAGRAARRVTKRPLAESLRDRDATPFGRRLTERIAARTPTGGLFGRLAVRNALHRRAGSATMFAQLTAAVAAVLIVATLVTTVNAFNDAEYEHWRWATLGSTPDRSLTIDDAAVTPLPGTETAVFTVGELDGWGVDVIGLDPASKMIDRTVDDGRWYGGADDVVLSTGFAERVGIDVGDSIELDLASGSERWDVVGLHPSRGRYVYTDRGALSTALGVPGHSNTVLTTLDLADPTTDVAAALPDVLDVSRLDDLTADDSGRDLIVYIFGAIGLVIVGVATLAVGSVLAVNVYERRYAFATVRSLGGRRRDVLRAVATELLPIAAVAVAAGVGLGYLGSLGIVSAFEQADAVEIGHVFAVGAIPVAAAAVIGGSLLIGAVMARQVSRRSPAVVLRGAV